MISRIGRDLNTREGTGAPEGELGSRRTALVQYSNSHIIHRTGLIKQTHGAPVPGYGGRDDGRRPSTIASLQHGSFTIWIWGPRLREIRTIGLEPRAAVGHEVARR